MHLTRPKSSKGRSRPAVNNTDWIQREAGSPESDSGGGGSSSGRPDMSLRSQSQPIMGQSSGLSRDQVLHMLQHAPMAPRQSFNKYKVLPSIERRRSDVSPRGSLDGNMSKLSLSDEEPEQPERPERPSTSARSSGASDGNESADGAGNSGAGGSLLLAIRAPCGSRFQQLFEPTDTLQAVRASAEARYGARYGGASIETMDVPCRSFSDMDMTLAQCGILNRSVLCISQRSDSVQGHD